MREGAGVSFAALALLLEVEALAVGLLLGRGGGDRFDDVREGTRVAEFAAALLGEIEALCSLLLARGARHDL